MMILILACGGPGGASGFTNGGNGGGGWDSGSGQCNTANEDCNVNTCRGDGPNMLPGSDCLACHSPGGDRDADNFGAGGTIYTDWAGSSPMGNVTVRVTDATGKVVEMNSYRSGNFYTEQNLTPPLRAEVENEYGIIEMDRTVDDGNCNSCHVCDDDDKIFAP